MSDNESQELHELVKNALRQIQPPYEEQHWTVMQQKIRGNPRRPYTYWLVGITVILIGSLLVITQKNSIFKNTKTPAITSVATKPTKNSESTLQIDLQAPSSIPKTDIPAKKRRVYPFLQNSVEGIQSNKNPKPTYPVNEIVPFKIPKPVPVSYPVINLNAPVEREIKKRLEQQIIGPDSVTSQAFERNKSRWRNVAVVCDFTSSMYPHATEWSTWLARNRRNRYIKGAVFFTDCDSLGRETTTDDPSGKMYVIKDWQNTDILPVFIAASRNTMGNVNRAENDLEAVLHAQKAFPASESFVLIADNSSPVKDMQLLSQIRKPVHIVVCGVTYEPKVAIQPDYLLIAAATKGSIHTLTNDLPDVSKIKPGTKIRLGNHTYKYRKGQFILRNANGLWKR